MNVKSLKDLPRIFFSRCNHGHRDLCPHDSGGKANQSKWTKGSMRSANSNKN